MGNDTYFWTKRLYPNLKYSCGHYLHKKLKQKYCIILSEAYFGTQRFNGYCSGYACKKRTYCAKYFTLKFKYESYKKYTTHKKKYRLLTNFNDNLISFSNSYNKNHKQGIMEVIPNNHKWNYILFFNKVHSLLRL